MTTTVINSVGVGKTYTTLNAWNVARAGDITAAGTDRIEIAEVYGDGSGNGVLSGKNAWVWGSTNGWSTDANHYIEIRAASGEAHAGVWDTSKALLKATGPTSNDGAVTLVANTADKRLDVHLVGLQIEMDKNNSMNTVALRSTPSGGSVVLTVDKCLIRATNRFTGNPYVYALFVDVDSGDLTAHIKNSVLLSTIVNQLTDDGWCLGVSLDDNCNVYVYNCDIICRTAGTSSGGISSKVFEVNGGYAETENCYLAFVGTADVKGCYDGGAVSNGDHDATVNGEATAVGLRNVLFDTTNFTNVGVLTEDLHIKTGSVLKDAGANLTSSGVTYDFVGMARPQGPAFDIGANEFEQNEPPICWNYTARYHNSNKLFKASGCGPFPRNLRVPGNVDTSSGKMVDDGILINPDEYQIV